MRPARTEFCHLFANYRKSTPPCRPAKSPRHVTQVVGRRPVACRKSPAAQTPRCQTRTGRRRTEGYLDAQGFAQRQSVTTGAREARLGQRLKGRIDQLAYGPANVLLRPRPTSRRVVTTKRCARWTKRWAAPGSLPDAGPVSASCTSDGRPERTGIWLTDAERGLRAVGTLTRLRIRRHPPLDGGDLCRSREHRPQVLSPSSPSPYRSRAAARGSNTPRARRRSIR